MRLSCPQLKTQFDWAHVGMTWMFGAGLLIAVGFGLTGCATVVDVGACLLNPAGCN